NAAVLADILAADKNVARVFYPGREDHPDYAVHSRQMQAGGTLIAMSLKGGRPEAFRFLNALKLVDISNNLGDTKSLACHPSSTTHRALSAEQQASMGLDESWVRLSVGLEDTADIAADLSQALNQI
ncbi:MAG: PLP-dependent transferase, partial [Henriciella sp.]